MKVRLLSYLLKSSFIMSNRRFTSSDIDSGSSSRGSGSSGSHDHETGTRIGGSYSPSDRSLSSDSSFIPEDLNSVYDQLFPDGRVTDLYFHDDKLKDSNNLLTSLFSLLFRNSSDDDTRLNTLQLLLQTLLSEQSYQRDLAYNELNYNRSKADNQVAQMMAAGMSRSAALQALNGGSSPQSVTPQGNITPFTAGDSLSPIMQGIDNVNGITQAMCRSILNMSNFDIDKRAKLLTNELLQHQSTLLGSQIQGLNDAAMFQQAIANAPAHVRDMSPYAQYGYFLNAAKLTPKDEGFDPSSFYFGNSKEFARCATNPYFWNALSKSSQDINAAYASVFEPEKAQAFIQQQRALLQLTNAQATSEQQRTKILTQQAFIDEAAAQARKDLEIIKAQCETHGYQFDDEKAKRFLQKVQDFSDLDITNMEYQLQRLRFISSPDVFQSEKDAYVGSLDYNVYQYMLGTAISSMKYGALQQYVDDAGNPIGDAQNWLRDYFRYQEFGGSEGSAARSRIAQTIFGGATATGALAFGGAKIYSFVKSAVPAAKAVVQSGSPSQPFNGIVPLVVPNAQLMQSKMFGHDYSDLIY